MENGKKNIKSLSEQSCIPCKGGIPPMGKDEIDSLQNHIPEWSVIEEKKIFRHYTFHNFQEALDWVNLVGKIAEVNNHHPDIFLTWGQVDISLWTHKIQGLSHADFVLAAKLDQAQKATP